MLNSLKSLLTPKISILLLSVCLQPVVTTWAAETVFSLPSASVVPEQGTEVGWAVIGFSKDFSTNAVTPGKQNLSLQVGVMSKQLMPYRRELLLFRLSAFPKEAQNVKAIKKVELRLVSNGVTDPNNQIGAAVMQVYHHSLKDAVLTNISTTTGRITAYDGALVASQAAATIPERGKELRLDVTQAIRAQLTAGKGGVACFRLEVQNEGGLDFSSDAYIQFLGFHTKNESARPQLVITCGE